jgi:hypothetical protein
VGLMSSPDQESTAFAIPSLSLALLTALVSGEGGPHLRFLREFPHAC